MQVRGVAPRNRHRAPAAQAALLRRCEEHLAATHLDRDRTQRFAAARPGHAGAMLQFEAGAVDRAHQQAILAAQEPARRPVQPARGMRAHVLPCANAAVRIAMQDQRLRLAVHHRLDLMQAAALDRRQRQQRAGHGIHAIAI